MIMESVYVRYSLDNEWAVKFTPENENEDGNPMVVRFDVASKNGQDWQETFSGQVKWDGCVDIGFAERVMIHFCGEKDFELLPVIYKQCEKMIGGFR